jgi:hypothetical protein
MPDSATWKSSSPRFPTNRYPSPSCPSPNERESGSGRITEDGDGADGELLTVNCVTLDSCLSRKSPIDLLVIDAEGAEVRILRGCRDVLSRDRPAVIVEAQEAALRELGFGLGDLQTELLGHDYRCYELARFGLSAVRTDDTRRTRNWLALPPNRAGEAAKIHRHLLCCGMLPCILGVNPLTRQFK